MNDFSGVSAGQFKSFRRYLQKQGLAVATVRAYVHDLELFDRWLGQEHAAKGLSLTKLGPADLGCYRRFLLKDVALKASTVNRRINALRAFFGWVQESKLRADNPALQVRFVRRSIRQQPPSLKRVEVLAMVRAAASSPHGLGERNCALLQLILQTGIRLAEVVRVKWTDVTIHARSGCVSLHGGKGMERSIPLNATAREALDLYRKTQAGKSQPAYIFQSKRDSPLSVRAAQDLIANISSRAKITRIPVSAHCLRHTFAANYLAENPGRLVELSSLMGHTSVETTAVYLRTSGEDLAASTERSELNVLRE